jgi:hypothetical protein
MTVSTRTPNKARPVVPTRLGGSRRVRAGDPIPTVEEAKRRLAAAGPDPWLTPEGIDALGQAEEAAGGWLVGPKVYRPSDAE